VIRSHLSRKSAPISLAAILAAAGVYAHGLNKAATIKGVVRGPQGPIAGANVRLQTSSIRTTTDADGSFNLTLPDGMDSAVLTAWAPGHYIGGGTEYRAGEREIEVLLERHGEFDNREYEWVSAFAEAGNEKACENCHSEQGNPESELPFDRWRIDAHANSVHNRRFLTMYLGTDVHGNKSPPTRYQTNQDYGKTPGSPRDDRPYYGPGYKIDFPATAGNCAACHAPLAAVNNPYGVDPSHLEDVEAEGIGCDFCHKIWDVTLDPRNGLPFDNRPGVISYILRRPEEGHQLFTGPHDDVAPGEDVYSPIQRESRYCAPCHSAKFWGIEIYNSYGEWLASPYANPGSQTTCQDCHMPSGRSERFARPAVGGKKRAPGTIFGHKMPGAGDAKLLQNAVTMSASAEAHDDTLEVRVEILNDRTGHSVPSDSPLRQMILIVRGVGSDGRALDQCGGPVLPDWCGQGDPDDGYVSGFPGKAYAKILEELWTGVYPSGAYWSQTQIRSDNRIEPFESDETTYLFRLPEDGEAVVDVLLLHRRAFIELSDWKGWETEDIEMARQTLRIDENYSPGSGLSQSAETGGKQ
jgi:hypothetical protein